VEARGIPWAPPSPLWFTIPQDSLEIVPHNPEGYKGDDHVNHHNTPQELDGVLKIGVILNDVLFDRSLDLSGFIAGRDTIHNLIEFGEHLKELIDDRGALEELNTATIGATGLNGFDLTVQEFHRELAGNLMIATTVRVVVLDTDSTVAERLPSEITGEIARGQGDDVRGSNNHDVLL